jgi:hypothetical protein
MTSSNKKTFTDFFLDGKANVADVEFTKCKFAHCLIMAADVNNRATIQDVRLLNCSQERCLMQGPILRNVLVDGLNTKGQMPDILGAVFDRVTLRGKIDRLSIKPWVVERSQRAAFEEANAELYKHVEWALDISQLDCKELDIKGVPVDLVRRDPETQGIVTYDRVAQGKWKGLPFQDGRVRIRLEDVEGRKFPGALILALTRDPDRKKVLADLDMLRKEGIAEPD